VWVDAGHQAPHEAVNEHKCSTSALSTVWNRMINDAAKHPSRISYLQQHVHVTWRRSSAFSCRSRKERTGRVRRDCKYSVYIDVERFHHNDHLQITRPIADTWGAIRPIWICVLESLYARTASSVLMLWCQPRNDARRMTICQLSVTYFDNWVNVVAVAALKNTHETRCSCLLQLMNG
jgi:hypothetical protein